MHHLVIGGAGFIGVNLAERLLGAGEQATLLDNLQRRGAAANVSWLLQRHPSLDVVEGDVRSDGELLERRVGRADVVYHLAAQVAVTTSVEDPRTDFDINAMGTFNVLEAMRRANTEAVLIYASTYKVYGAMEEIPVVESATRYAYGDGRAGITEEQLLDFHSAYGCSKGAADQYVRDYARVYGLRTVVLRQSCIYGRRQFGVEDQGWLAWFCIAAVLGRPITIFGTGKQVRDVLHVDDLADLMVRIADDPGPAAGRIYNVGGGERHTLSLLEALDLLGQELDMRIAYDSAPSRVGDQPIYVSDTSKISRELGWRRSAQSARGSASSAIGSRETGDLLSSV